MISSRHCELSQSCRQRTDKLKIRRAKGKRFERKTQDHRIVTKNISCFSRSLAAHCSILAVVEKGVVSRQ